MLVSNVPAAIQGAELLGSLVFKNAGVGYKVIPVNSGTADVAPQLQAAVSWGAKAIGLTGDVTLCSSFLKGYQTLGLTDRQGAASDVDAAHGPALRRHYLCLQRQGHPAAAERLLAGKRRRHP
jgi:hypothetical protein